MISIGFRASPREVFYTILRQIENESIEFESSSIQVPQALDTPDQLRFIRTNLLDVTREFRASRAGIRITEANADPSRERVYLEGIIQEMLASSHVERYFSGAIPKIGGLLDIERDELKTLIDNRENYFGVADWDTLNNKEKVESFYTGLAALYL